MSVTGIVDGLPILDYIRDPAPEPDGGEVVVVASPARMTESEPAPVAAMLNESSMAAPVRVTEVWLRSIMFLPSVQV